MSGTGQAAQRLPLGLILLLGSLAALGPFSIDMYLPALPAMQAHFASDAAAVQATLSAYFIGLAAGQLAFGPVADRYGRRRPLLFGLVMYCAASIGCMFAPSIEILIALRFLQAVGACAGMVVSRAVLRDLFPPQDMARALSMLLLVMGIAPIIAPMVGSLIFEAFGWQALFLALGAYGSAVTVAVWLTLAETLREPGSDLSVAHVTRGYAGLLRSRYFMGYALAGGLAQSGMFAYIASSSFVFLQVYGLSPTQYAWLFGLIAFGLISASQINARLLRRLSAERLLRHALGAFVVATAILLVCAVAGVGGAWGIAVPLFVSISTLGFGFPNTTAAAMAPFAERAGFAAALLGTLQFGLSGISSYFAGHYFDGSAVPLAMVMFACGIGSQLALRLLVPAHGPAATDAMDRREV